MGIIYNESTKGSVKESVNLYDIFISKYGQEVKPREGNNIRLVCPECGHKSLSCNVANGLVNCFQCGYGKGKREIGISSGFAEPETDNTLHLEVTKKLLEICTLDSRHKEYLKSRGITKPEDYGLVSTPYRIDRLLLEYFSYEELSLSGYFYKSVASYMTSRALDPDRILIPFWQGDQVIGLKSRGFGEAMRYICPRGSQVKDKIWWKHIGRDVIVTEGELAAITGNSNGFHTIGIPGLALAKSKKLRDEIEKLCVDCKRIFIILDSDPEYLNDPTKLNCSLALNSITNSCIAYLPQDKPDECMDLDLFIARYGSEELEDHLEDMWPKRDKIKNDIQMKLDKL